MNQIRENEMTQAMFTFWRNCYLKFHADFVRVQGIWLMTHICKLHYVKVFFMNNQMCELRKHNIIVLNFAIHVFFIKLCYRHLSSFKKVWWYFKHFVTHQTAFKIFTMNNFSNLWNCIRFMYFNFLNFKIDTVALGITRKLKEAFKLST